MRFSKDKKKYYGFGKIGPARFTGINVWDLGFHLFECDGDKIFRFVFLKTKKHTYYYQYSKKIKEIGYVDFKK